MRKEPKILIIEDNADDGALLMRQLKKAEVEKHVGIMHDGAQALAYLTNDSLDSKNLSAVFLDLNLPKVHGIKLLTAIRNSDRLRDLPVIVMTSSNSPEDLEQCRKLGVAAFVQKPLTFSSFAKAFADTFHARRAATTDSQER